MPYTRSVYQRIGEYIICASVSICISTVLPGCFPVSPPAPEPLAAPGLSCEGFIVVPDDIDGYHAAIRLNWTTDFGEDVPLESFTLLRKFSGDSIYDVFQGARQIPPDTMHFHDKLTGYSFPETGYDSVYYRILPVDTAGRAGDTSAAVTFVLAPQPTVHPFTAVNACLSWESWIRGGVFSWCSFWHERGEQEWVSGRFEEFPDTDEPARFSACFPDSLSPPLSGVWFYACFIKANTAQSLVIGSFNVQ
jgi:hypothetical protein